MYTFIPQLVISYILYHKQYHACHSVNFVPCIAFITKQNYSKTELAAVPLLFLIISKARSCLGC